MGKKGSAAGQQSGSAVIKVKRWFSHRNLIAVEVLMAIDILLRQAKIYLMNEIELVNWAKILIVMALTIGFFGFIMVGLTRVLAIGLEGAHRTVSAIPLLRHHLIIHAVICVGFFIVYAWQYGVLDHLHQST